MYHYVYIKEFEIIHIYKAPRRLPSANQEQSTVSAARNDATVSSLLRSSRRGETKIWRYHGIHLYIYMYACMYVSFNNFGVKQSAEYEIMKGDEASIS
jgi:hypothetical protein